MPGVLGGLGEDVQEAPAAPTSVAPGSNQGASGSGCDASRSGSVRTTSSVRRGHLSYCVEQPGQRLARQHAEPGGVRFLAASSVSAGIATGRRTMKLGPARSTWATCLIRPPRHSALTVVR